MMKLIKLINPEKVLAQEAEKYPTRETVRALVFDESDNIAFLHVTRDQYFKLPGGGMEIGEDHLSALNRECLEEIGCEIEIASEIGKVVEYRKFCNLKQTSYCYLANLKGEKGRPNFMPDEMEEGSKEVWIPKDQALNLLLDYPGITLESSQYIVPRDIAFFQSIDENKY